MKITLIKPNIGRMESGPYIDEGRMEPLQLGLLAGMLPRDIEVAAYDDRMEPIPYDNPTDLVAITVETFTAKRAYEISAEYRQRGVPVILGGIHPTLIPDEAAQHADSLYLGDAEFLWRKVVSDAQKGKLQSLYKADVGTPQPRILPRRDILVGKGYLPITLLQFSRGCHFSCYFCAISTYFNKTQYIREIREVIQEIESQDRKFLFFVDDNIASNKEALKTLCRELIPLKVRWVSQASLDITSDQELLRLMSKSGCVGHVIGFESLDLNNLRTMKKASNLLDFSKDYKIQLEILRDHGLQTWASFTLGHDHDSKESIKQTLAFALENKFCFAAFNVLLPYPSTPFYKIMQETGRLLYEGKWWLHPDYRFNHAAITPKLMTANELTNICFEARSSFNSLRSIFKRAFDFKTNMRSPYRFGTYLTFNPIFRKEVFKKQGMLFGIK